MSDAALLEEPAARCGDVDALVESDDLETLESALAELNHRLSEHALTKQSLSDRWWQLTHGAKEVRRRRVRASIPLPRAVTFSGIFFDHELEEQSEQVRSEQDTSRERERANA